MRIVVIGDSMVTGLRTPEGCSFPSILNRETPDEWINLGVNGDSSYGILARLSSEAFPLKPDAVLLNCGGNDLMLTANVDLPKTAMMGFTHQCAARGIKPIVSIPIPFRSFPEKWHPAAVSMERFHASLDEYIKWLRVFVSISNLRYVDFAKAFEENEHLGLWQDDLMHPNELGHRIMADAVLHSNFYHTAHPGK
ncbi:MAG: hypothetical protein IJU01_02345 [Lachnospiraceae bacterium]|nr:hypothetical protein [Lachnospiraceae bacterium]